MWVVDPEEIWRKSRRPGISGFMYVKNEAEFIDRAIATHLPALDELVIVHNGCSDETPEIAARWQRLSPEKVRVYEYEPEVVPIATEEARTLDFHSPHSYSNARNYALAKTRCTIAIKIDGDHIAVLSRLRRICGHVRKHLAPKTKYPIYGLNLTRFAGKLAAYNFYNFSPSFGRARPPAAPAKIGPPPFTSGDHIFFRVDASTYHQVDRSEGMDAMVLPDFRRSTRAAFTYCFFHMKGMKQNQGRYWDGAGSSLRKTWSANVAKLSEDHVTSLAEMRFHNPAYFRAADIERDLREAGIALPLRQPVTPKDALRLPLRERIADLWYRLEYP